MKVKHYSVLSIDIPVADRDAGGIYHLKTQTGYKSYRVDEDTKYFIPLDATDVISDEVISTEKTWSSDNINEELGSKQDVFTTEGGLELDNALLKLKLRTEDLRIDENEELAVQLTAWSPLTFYKNKKIEHQGATEES